MRNRLPQQRHPRILKGNVMVALRTLRWVLLLSVGPVWADVVISEIHYNPPDDGFEAGSLREFVELYNPGPGTVDLTGYRFTRGITFTFPAGAALEPDSYLVLVRDLRQRTWQNMDVQRFGPYEGKLSNSGERISLVRPGGIVVDGFTYSDEPPWPFGADGYGRSMERIAWDLPADDFHSWRASLPMEGTPGQPNSVHGTLPRPVVTAVETIPKHPSSTDEVTVRIGVDTPAEIESATLRWEQWSTPPQPVALVNTFSRWSYHPGLSAPLGGDAWTDLGYDQQGWAAGTSGFGYGSIGYVATEIEGMRNSFSTLYIRKSFQIDDPSQLGGVTLGLYFDDGFVCYINGREVARNNAPEVVGHDSLATAWNDWYDAETVELGDAEELLHAGENVIAVIGMNQRLDSSDFFVMPVLFAEAKTQDRTGALAMQQVAASPSAATFEAVIPAQPSQRLIRCNLALALEGDRTLILPHVSEPTPFFSYFVYDGEVESLLPVMWLFEPTPSQLTESERSVSGVAILPPSQTAPELFDGALVIPSRNGQKVRFLKGAEFRGDRTLNIIPESPTSYSTARASAPHREHLAFWFMREMGVLAPRADWFRIVTPAGGSMRQTQQAVIQQINERFLEMNGRDPDGYLFKRNYVSPNWEPHTRLEEGDRVIASMTRQLRKRDPVQLRETMESLLDLDELLSYTAASACLGNWDGYHNNHWMYRASEEDGLWEVLPWDLDKAWGFTDGNPMYTEMPLDFPIDGQADPGSGASRSPGPVYGWAHKDEAFHDAYLQRIRREMAGLFSEEFLFDKIAEVEALLLDDLDLLKTQSGSAQEERQGQILESNAIIRAYIQARRAYLDQNLPELVAVEDWALY